MAMKGTTTCSRSVVWEEAILRAGITALRAVEALATCLLPLRDPIVVATIAVARRERG